MNLRRGLFRLWLVTSILFVILVTVVMWDSVAREFSDAALEAQWDKVSAEAMPIDCQLARGVEGTDFVKTKPWAKYESPPKPDGCWYTMASLRSHYPEYDDLTDEEIKTKLLQLAGLPATRSAAPWTFISEVAAVALGVPLAALLIGSAFMWALAGFRR